MRCEKRSGYDDFPETMVLTKVASNEKKAEKGSGFPIFHNAERENQRRWLRYGKNEIAIDAFAAVVLKWLPTVRYLKPTGN